MQLLQFCLVALRTSKHILWRVDAQWCIYETSQSKSVDTCYTIISGFWDWFLPLPSPPPNRSLAFMSKIIIKICLYSFMVCDKYLMLWMPWNFSILMIVEEWLTNLSTQVPRFILVWTELTIVFNYILW